MAVQSPASLRTKAFIDGRFRDAETGETFPTENPATGQKLADIASGGSGDIDAAVAAARCSFDDGRWSRRSPAERQRVLLKLADLVDANLEELALLDALEAGKPITACRAVDVPQAAKRFRWYAEAIDKVYDKVAPTDPQALALIVREPIGVVGTVLPWNYPVMLAAQKAAPALAVGDSIVIKPSELSSLSALRLAELAAMAGLPDGVLNVVPGFGETAGQALGRHMDVDVLSFTGSTDVGRMFLRYASESNLKGVVLECGGKSPQVVLETPPDLDAVADELLAAGFTNMGENCTSGSRVIVHASVHDELLARLVDRTGSWCVGDPLEPGTKIGPMIEEAHLAKVLRYVELGRSEGAEIATGGTRALERTGGYFVNPTIFRHARNTMRIARDEIFGPVIALIQFTSEDEAVALANDTSYGLSASVYGAGFEDAYRVARSIKAGLVSINCFSEGDITTPSGGWKESGFGGRDKGFEAFAQYTETKTIWIGLR